MTHRRHGVTLVELIVVLAILALTAGVAGLAFRAPARSSPEEVRVARIAAARAEALESGRPVRAAVDSTAAAGVVTAYPDGSVVAEPDLAVDRLTGKPGAHAY